MHVFLKASQHFNMRSNSWRMFSFCMEISNAKNKKTKINTNLSFHKRDTVSMEDNTTVFFPHMWLFHHSIFGSSSYLLDK